MFFASIDWLPLITTFCNQEETVTMQRTSHGTDSSTFDRETYVRMLIAIAHADRENSRKEYDYIRKQAIRFGVDFDEMLEKTDRHFEIGALAVSRLTALRVLKDAIIIASMDNNFSLPEKERTYTYAEKLDIPRADVDELETLVREFRSLEDRWKKLVAGTHRE